METLFVYLRVARQEGKLFDQSACSLPPVRQPSWGYKPPLPRSPCHYSPGAQNYSPAVTAHVVTLYNWLGGSEMGRKEPSVAGDWQGGWLARDFLSIRNAFLGAPFSIVPFHFLFLYLPSVRGVLQRIFSPYSQLATTIE